MLTDYCINSRTEYVQEEVVGVKTGEDKGGWRDTVGQKYSLVLQPVGLPKESQFSNKSLRSSLNI